MNDKMRFPLIELTDWIFKVEKSFFDIVEYETQWRLRLKENEIGKHYIREIVDSNGYIIKITEHKATKRYRFFSLFPEPLLDVEFTFEKTKKQMPLDKLKKKILSKSSQLFDIVHNQLMTEAEFIEKINNAVDYKNVILTATFSNRES